MKAKSNMSQTNIELKNDYQLLEVTSSAFEHLGNIPVTYTCEGENINPPLTIEKIPEAAKSLVLIVDDPDANGREWSHWVVWNIPPMKNIAEGNVPGIEGINDFTLQCYSGPCPPSGIHHYHFKIYALNTLLDIPSHSTKHQVEMAMSPYIIAFGELVGVYKKIFI